MYRLSTCILAFERRLRSLDCSSYHQEFDCFHYSIGYPGLNFGGGEAVKYHLVVKLVSLSVFFFLNTYLLEGEGEADSLLNRVRGAVKHHLVVKLVSLSFCVFFFF